VASGSDETLLHGFFVRTRSLTNKGDAVREGLDLRKLVGYFDHAMIESSLSSAANSTWLASYTNSVGTSVTNGPSVGSESGLLLQIGVGSAPGVATHAKLDLRPSVWDAAFSAAVGVIKKLGVFFMLTMFFIVVRGEIKERMDVYYTAMSGAGKSLTGTTMAGAIAAVSIRFGVAAAVTAIVAILPSVMMGYLEAGGYGIVNLLDLGMTESAATGNSDLISGTARALVLVDRFISYPTLMMCIVNYYVIQTMEAGLMAVAMATYRFLPVVLAFGLVVASANGAEIVVDNRLSQPVEVVTDRTTHASQALAIAR